MKTVKALRYEMDKDEKFDKQLGIHYISVFYPVIVFDGHLYSLVVDNEKISPIQKNYLMYQFEYKHGYNMIDIVTKSGLAEFIKLLNNEFRRIKERHKKLLP
jgi:hypothetical protein